MIRILIVALDQNVLFNFITGLEKNNGHVTRVKTCDEAFLKLEKEKFDLIITDNLLDHGIECVEKLIASNPMLNCAVISALPPDEFHEITEGMGILMQLPTHPLEKDAIKLLEHLNTILNLTKKVIS